MSKQPIRSCSHSRHKRSRLKNLSTYLCKSSKWISINDPKFHFTNIATKHWQVEHIHRFSVPSVVVQKKLNPADASNDMRKPSRQVTTLSWVTPNIINADSNQKKTITNFQSRHTSIFINIYKSKAPPTPTHTHTSVHWRNLSKTV